MKYIYSVSVLILVSFFVNSSVFAYSHGPPDKRTGSPDELTCATAGCHLGNSLNSEGGSLVLTVPETFTPGMVYDIIVELTRSGQSKWGFEMTALNSSNTKAGTFTKTDANTQVTETDDRQYIKHTTQGNANGKKDSNSWSFKWTAPTSDVGEVTFYTAGNASNGNFNPADDYIYTQTSTSEVVTHGVSITSDEERKESTDANTGVEYILKVTNTGNVEDTIQLSSSAEFGIGGAVLGSFKKVNSQDIATSQLEITLNPGETKDVIFIASGDLLTKPATYPIVVTASSKGDSSKTAKITTITTITAVYGVSIEGIGELTQEIADLSTGVNYKVRITNTGNDRDTIILSTSGEITANLSTSVIILNSGAFRDISISIPIEALSKAGVYEVKVSASSSSDISKTDEILTKTVVLPIYEISIDGIGELTSETSDASDGVSYKFTISNTGNTDDVIDLSTSGNVSGTLSQTSVSLSYGSSTDVTLTIPGSVLAKAGDYSVNVTATSQGNPDKTAMLSTKTTILPVYDVTVEGIGDLTTETSDASDGVSYKFTISNTGNTDDVIDLSTSGNVSGTLSQTSVSLSYGSSTEITLTIPGSELSKAGDYSVMVTATSQGDSGKSAVVSTITTILPVYDISISKPTISTEIIEGSVSYLFTVINNGNTDDIINLSSTGEVSSTLSQESVSLSPSSSAQITLTITTAELTSGNYSVTLTGTSQGDSSVTTESEVSIEIGVKFGVILSSEDKLQGNTTDILNGVSFQLTLTNTGNIEDTILLSSSAEVGIEGSVLGSFIADRDQEISTSQVEITLNPGSSVTLTFKTTGDYFTKPGDYEIIVTATSLGDDTKTDQIKTTTTIKPVVWDLNADGIVNILDLVIVSNQFDETGEGLNGDVNMDGTVNILDLVQVASYFGKSQVEIVQTNM